MRDMPSDDVKTKINYFYFYFLKFRFRYSTHNRLKKNILLFELLSEKVSIELKQFWLRISLAKKTKDECHNSRLLTYWLGKQTHGPRGTAFKFITTEIDKGKIGQLVDSRNEYWENKTLNWMHRCTNCRLRAKIRHFLIIT